jgi:hypothetical protein
MSIAYKNMAQRVSVCVDKLGKHIDHEIRHTVIAFNLLGLHTTASCAGHMKHGLPYPWIDLHGNERQQCDLLLEEFNKEYVYIPSLQLKTVNYGSSSCRVMHYLHIGDDGVKDKKLLIDLRKDMNNFADFLIGKLK